MLLAMAARFVILHHTTAGGEHWDLMLEHGDALLTWQLPRDPSGDAGLPMPAIRIDDHRKRYLDYEGPISRGRGDVRRVDSGTVEILELTASRCVFTLGGGQLHGRFVLTAQAGEWVLDRLAT